MQQPRVISYRRFSSARQAKGHSLERQTDKAAEWCQARGWKLDDLRPTDLGVSAFTGANRDKGALGALLKTIELGLIEPGTYLLIEALDRLTRSVLTESVPLVTDLVNAGLIIITLVDGKEWSRDGMNKNMADFMFSVMLLSRAHEESKSKGSRVRARFEQGRATHSRQEFGSAPGWLTRVSKEAPWQVIEERAESVRQVFELAAAGYGSKAIAKRANDEGWPIPTRDTVNKSPIWHAVMPGRLLRMREVTGAHEYRLMGHDDIQAAKHWKGLPSGICVPDYYPRIVSEDLWHQARASIQQRMTATRRRDEHYFNIWSGLLRCGECGAMIQRKTEYRGASKAQLICSNKLAGVTACKTGAASKTDKPLLLDICALAGEKLGLGYDKDKAVKAIDVARSKLRDNSMHATNIADAIATLGLMPELMSKARALKEERDVLEVELQALQQMLVVESNSMLDNSYAERVLDLLYTQSEEAKQLRADCNTRLSRAVVAIWHWAYDVAIVQYKDSNLLQNIGLESKTQNGTHPKMLAAAMGTLDIPGLVSRSIE